MRDDLIISLRAQRGDIRARWAELLRAAPVSGPLGNPDVLIHMMDWTFDEILRRLALLTSDQRKPQRATAFFSRHDCPCRRSPLLSYFLTAQEAFIEALARQQADAHGLLANHRDASLLDLKFVLHDLARKEMETLCDVCREGRSPRIVRHEHAPARRAFSTLVRA